MLSSVSGNLNPNPTPNPNSVSGDLTISSSSISGRIFADKGKVTVSGSSFADSSPLVMAVSSAELVVGAGNTFNYSSSRSMGGLLQVTLTLTLTRTLTRTPTRTRTRTLTFALKLTPTLALTVTLTLLQTDTPGLLTYACDSAGAH